MLRLLLALCLAFLVAPTAMAAPSAHGPYVDACRAAAVRVHGVGADQPARQSNTDESRNGNIRVFVGDAISCEFGNARQPQLVSLYITPCYDCGYALDQDTIDKLNTLLAAKPKRSCWVLGEVDTWSLCFDGKGGIDAGIFYPDEHEGLGAGGRYRGTGNRIIFETEPDWLSEAWPWEWSKVTCTLGGPEDVMALTACVGSGTHWPDTAPASHEPVADLTLIRQ